MLDPFATGVYNECMCDINCIQVLIKFPPSPFILFFESFTIEMISLFSTKLKALLYVFIVQ